MKTNVFDIEFVQTLQAIQDASINPSFKKVRVNNNEINVPYPYPSPTDWRDGWIYFLMIDRFNNPATPPKSEWNKIYNFHQGGTFKGIQQQLPYIASLGASAIWLSPVMKNSRPDSWAWNYHGYAIQDFLTVEGRFGSDSTSATAEKELIELIEEAHARGIYIIFDIVINHTSRVFDYVINGTERPDFKDKELLEQIMGGEPPVRWLNGFGFPRSDWENKLPSPAELSEDDAIWPSDLQRADFFRRRGEKISDVAAPGSFAKGDFGSMRQLVVEYNAEQYPEQNELRLKYGKAPVLNILILIHQYLIARFDIDGFRIDTVKYVDPDMVQIFGNAIREFALSVGKKNFFTFGEIYDNEETIANFVGRNSTRAEGYGIDAALDFPLFYKLPKVAKGDIGAEEIQEVFKKRKDAEEGLLSSHGEAGRFFVSFLDNHDLHERFNHPKTPQQQIVLGITVLFCLQGVPCLYYGTEQGLNGIQDDNGNVLQSKEAVREALWGKQPAAFDENHSLFKHIQYLSKVRKCNPALRYGRLYFREISGNGKDFGISEGQGGVLAFSRILNNKEVIVVANTNFNTPFSGFVLVDTDINKEGSRIKILYPNSGILREGATVQIVDEVRFYKKDAPVSVGKAACLFIEAAPMEVQILASA